MGNGTIGQQTDRLRHIVKKTLQQEACIVMAQPRAGRGRAAVPPPIVEDGTHRSGIHRPRRNIQGKKMKEERTETHRSRADCHGIHSIT
jgi:hypothetical protein